MPRRGSGGRPPRRQILVFTEGKVTEPTYLAAWGRRVRTHTIVNLDERTGLDPRGLVELAVEAKRTEAQDERRKRGRAHDEYWCVFDVDEHTRTTARGPAPTLRREMSTPHPAPEHDENLELPVEELLQRATVHPPYGEQVIDDLTPEEADAFLDAVLS